MKASDSFYSDQRAHQERWRDLHIKSKALGRQNGVKRRHIIPKTMWLEALWEGIRSELPEYLNLKGIHSHTGTHNLLSSWVACANIYFPIYTNDSLRDLFVRFLQTRVSPDITAITAVELEFAFPTGHALHPSSLLGEQDGSRGSGQTSPDVAFLVATNKGQGIVLLECKYTEHSFYPCSARRTGDKGERKGNPDPSRCMVAAKGYDYSSICHQSSVTWGRKYWQYLRLTSLAGMQLTRCPAATAGYQLFRQHALASGISKSGRYDLVASCVALDGRNTDLLGSLKSTGIKDIASEWGKLFSGKALFKLWTHQDWVGFVRGNQVGGQYNSWLAYVNSRYGY